MNIGKMIREARKEKGLSQTQLAQMLNTTQDTISLWELGKSCPDAENIIKLCKIFSISSDELLGIIDY